MIRRTHSHLCASLRATLLTIVALSLCACQPSETLTERVPRGDWSRGMRLGTTCRADSAPLSVSPVDGSLRVFWVSPPEAGQTASSIHMARLDASARVLSNAALPLDTQSPSRLSVEGDSSGGMRLFWLDGATGGGTIWQAALSPQGTVMSTEPVTTSAIRVASFSTAADASGGVHVVWVADEDSGRAVRYLHVGAGGEPDGPSLDLGVDGLVAALTADTSGRVHIAWATEPEAGLRDIRYAAIEPGSDTPSPGTTLATLAVPTGQVLRDPSLGISADGVTVFWALERRGGGLVPPSADSRYVFIPGGRASEAFPPRDVTVPPAREPSVAEADSTYHLSWLAPATSAEGESEFVYYAAPLSTSGAEMAVALSAQMVGRTRSVQQILLTLWSGGQMTGYQVIAQTANSSIHPALATDAAGDLYVTWIDTAGFGAYDVYVAGTSASARATLDKWRPQDVGSAILDGLWKIVQAAGFLPMTVIWVVLPLMVLATYAVIHPEGDLTRCGPRAILGVACVLFEVTKFTLRPGWLTEFPVPRWVPPALAERVILLAPLAIAVFAALLTWLWARRHQYPSLFPVFFVFTGSDVLLTLLCYVPGVLSE